MNAIILNLLLLQISLATLRESMECLQPHLKRVRSKATVLVTRAQKKAHVDASDMDDEARKHCFVAADLNLICRQDERAYQVGVGL